jgi:phage terminase large subunit
MVLKLEATRIFERNAASTARVVINVGGARSSKSYSILQLLAVRFLSRFPYRCLITRKTGPALKASAYASMIDILATAGMLDRVIHNKTDRTLQYKGNLIAFISIDDPQKIKSTEWNDVFLEEANEFTYEDYIVLKTRLSAPAPKGHRNQMFLAFNPSDEHGYIHTRVEAEPDVEVIHSTYRDNPFLAREYIEILEGLASEDPTYHKIYALGEYATPTGIIYPVWTQVDELPVNPDETIYGVDFGFNVQAGLVRIDLKDGAAACDELLYKTHLTNTELIAQVKDLIGLTSDPLYCDAAEPDRIEEFAQAGFNVFPADKDVAFGIDTVKKHKLQVTKRSANMITELRAYKWKVDRAGNVLDEPVKFKDHLMDAMRYALHTHTGARFLTVQDMKGAGIVPLTSTAVAEGF